MNKEQKYKCAMPVKLNSITNDDYKKILCNQNF